MDTRRMRDPAEEDRDAILRGEYDRKTEQRILALALDAMSLDPERLDRLQRRALVKVAMGIVASYPLPIPFAQTLLLQGLVCGFLLGHNYALAHGPLKQG